MNFFKNKSEETLFLNNTIIEHGMVVDAASLTGSCGLVVRGILKGLIDIDADILIDSSGSVDGEITCLNCVIKGRVNGNISTTGNITISEDGEVFGDVRCSTFQIEKGGNFRGSCNKTKKIGDAKTNLFEIFVEKDEKIHLSTEDCFIGQAEGETFRDACNNYSHYDKEFADGFDYQSLSYCGRKLVEIA